MLPDQVAPAVLWTLDLDADGEQTAVDVRRALVRSRDRLDYAGVQQLVDSGRADERLQLLAEVGKLRMALEVERGGVSLPIPEQEVVENGGSFSLAYRTTVPVESWNEQISLMTGMAAADLMLHGEVGVLRTLPKAPDGALERLRRAAHALGVPWPAELSYAEVVHGLDPANPRHAALLEEATSLLRGAGYTAFDGGVPDQATHAAVAAEYAHATAPLRRLVDRYVGAVCLALCAGEDVPGWTLKALPRLPEEMAAADRQRARAGARVRRPDGGGRAARPRGPGVRRGGGRAGRQAWRWHGAAGRPRRTCLLRGQPAAGRPGPGPAGRGRRGQALGAFRRRLNLATLTRTADEPAGRPRRDLRVSPRKVRAPQGKVVGNAHPG